MIGNGYIYAQIASEELLLDSREAAARMHVSVGYTNELIERCDKALREAIDCRYCARKVKIVFCSEDTVDLGFGKIRSGNLCAALSGCDEAFLFVATLGHGVDRLIHRLSVISAVQSFVTDALASAYAESAAEIAEANIKGAALCRPRFSPGYGDLPLDIQPNILDMLNAGKLLNITLGKTLLMSPKKSITAIMGIEK